ncbi:thiosulfate transporter TsuA-like isoform X2 [Amphiura filiformis]|uniref:thiosulfate transporter TsuA-like isoform X2 n=1 Tax=Amphiura filiformis TaxID=82378 RepID=UPI003B210586
MADTSKTNQDDINHNQDNGGIQDNGGNQDNGGILTKYDDVGDDVPPGSPTPVVDHTTLEMVENDHQTSTSSKADLVPQEQGDKTEVSSVDEDAMIYCCLQTTSFKLFVCFATGFMFGLAMEKGRVYEPRVIRSQFIYERFIMVKMFLAAVGFGALCLALLSVLPFTREPFERAFKSYAACLPRKGILAVIIGGSLLGAGMVVAGACPGMVLVQVGAWVGGGSCLMTLLGCFVAALAYGLVEPYVAKLIVPKKPYEKQAAMHFVKLPFSVLAIAMAAVTAVIVFTLEWFFPWKEELFIPNSPVSWFMQLLAWPPYVAGIIIGAMQIPIVLAVGDTLGGSSSYCTIISQLLCTKSMESRIPYLAGYKRGIDNWWQVFYVCGAVFGGCMSALASHSLGSVPGVSLQSSFIGGFLMVFGARIAGGCTSGHGLSGVGLLMMLSMLAAAAMFAGGTIVGFICLAMDKANLIDYYTF